MTLMTLLVLDVTWGVVSRYFLGQQGKWTEEMARVLLIWVSLLGASLGFETNRHLGMDYFVGKLHPAARKWAHYFVLFIIIMFAVVILMIGGARLVFAVYSGGQSLISLPVSKAWVYIVIPISGFFIAMFSVEQVFEAMKADEKDNQGEATS